MKMINLTPHDLYIVDADGNHKATVPPSGTVARVAVRRVEVAELYWRE